MRQATSGGKGDIDQHGICAITSPFLGGLRLQRKTKRLLLSTRLSASYRCPSFRSEKVWSLKFFLVLIANSDGRGLVFYNSFLPISLSRSTRQGSAGVRVGYAGSILSSFLHCPGNVGRYAETWSWSLFFCRLFASGISFSARDAKTGVTVFGAAKKGWGIPCCHAEIIANRDMRKSCFLLI